MPLHLRDEYSRSDTIDLDSSVVSTNDYVTLFRGLSFLVIRLLVEVKHKNLVSVFLIVIEARYFVPCVIDELSLLREDS